MKLQASNEINLHFQKYLCLELRGSSLITPMRLAVTQDAEETLKEAFLALNFMSRMIGCLGFFPYGIIFKDSSIPACSNSTPSTVCCSWQ